MIRYLPVIFVGLICLYFIWAGVGIWLFSDATAYERAAGIIFLIAAALGLAGVVVACWCHQPYGALLWFAAIISLCMIVFPLFSNSQDRGLLLSLGFLATIFTLCMTARPVDTSPRFIKAMACTLPRWLRKLRLIKRCASSKVLI